MSHRFSLSAYAFILLAMAACADDDTTPPDSSVDAADTTATDTMATDTAGDGSGVGEPDTSEDITEVDVPTPEDVTPREDIVEPQDTVVAPDIEDDADEADTRVEGDTIELPEQPTEVAIDADDGGLVEHAGAGLLVPAGALSDDATLTVDAEIMAVDGLDVVGAVYNFGPDGTQFLTPVRISLPVVSGSAAASTIWWTDTDGEFQPLPTFVDGDEVYAFVDHFSSGVVVQCGTLTCNPAATTCADTSTLSVTTSSCRAGACVDSTSTVDCTNLFPNVANGACAVDVCEWTGCVSGFTDCDSNPANGCETRGSCTPSLCGDGTLDAANGEQCDDGNNNGGDGCSADCLTESCVPTTEVCDGVDNDCDGLLDEEAVGSVTYYADADADGFGSDVNTLQVCSPPAGYVTRGGDCDDTNLGIYPGAIETCGDGVDNNCSGQADEGCSLSFCGDGNVDTGAGEQCDDGNSNDGDGCSSACLTE